MLEQRTDTTEQFAQVGKVELCYETIGPEDADPMLLVMGLGSQMILWEDGFCAMLVDRGYRVIRFDNRDSGRSTIFRDRPIPTVRQLALRDGRGAAYTLDEMAGDAVGLLDHLGIDSAHLVGASMGGMIAQLIAINHPERARSLVSIMSTTGNWRVGIPRPSMVQMLLRRPGRGREAAIASFAKVYGAIGSRRYPMEPDRMRMLAERCFDRGLHPAGTVRQLGAIQAASDRTNKLRKLTLPAAAIHGKQDPLVSVSGGRATANAIPGARLRLLDGMAHDMPRPLWPEMVETIVRTAR